MNRLFISLSMLIALMPALAANAAEPAPAADSPMATIRYCDYPVYPPISWRDNSGEVRGLAPHAVREVFARLDMPVEVVVLGSWKRCLTDVAQGRVDMVIAYRTEGRSKDLLFSQVALLREEVALFYNSEKPLTVNKLADLKGYRGGLLFGESYGQAFDKFVAENGNIEWVTSNRQNFGKLVRGRIDFIAQERRTGQLFVEHLAGAENIQVLPVPVAVDHLYFAVSKRSPLAAHMAEIDQELQRIVDAGEVEQWLQDSEKDYRAMQAAP